jgi:hypothetical protein
MALKPLGVKQLGDERQSSSDLSYHGGNTDEEGMHGCQELVVTTMRSFTDQMAERKRACEGWTVASPHHFLQ